MENLKIKRLKRFSNIFFVIGIFLAISGIAVYFYADHVLKTQLHDVSYFFFLFFYQLLFFFKL